jgi:predicted nuclease of predicted toxin-antitoxin system
VTGAVKLRLFIDHCVPESVAKAFETAGHEVIRLREKTAPDSPDMLVAAVSEANDAILVTMDGDFKAIAARAGIGARRYRKLSLIRFERCRESKAADRARDAMSLIEHEWLVGGSERDRRMFVVIGSASIRTHR